MIRPPRPMVLWSYLLLSVPATASFEKVLAPLDSDAAGSRAESSDTDGELDDATTAVNESHERAAAKPLVQVGADEIDLLAELERQLVEKTQPAGQLRLIPVSPLPSLPRSAQLPAVELIDHPSRIATTSVLLRFRLSDGERVLGSFAASFRVQLVAEVWTPARRLSPGEVLGVSDVVRREVDLIRESKAITADTAIFGEYELARAVAPERSLTWNDLVPRSLVRKGQVVEVVANEGMLSISMKGQATRNGTRGEVINVRNLESKREFPAEVIDENKVRVQF